MKLSKYAGLFVGVVLSFGLLACGGDKVISRVDSGAQIDLSGNWNDTDSQLVSKEMISESFSNPWADRFYSENRRPPRVIIGTVLNKSEEHINTETFVKDLQKNLINSGKADFVASSSQRGELRTERDEQAVNAKDAKRQRYEEAADFMLKGQINTIFDVEGKNQVKYYQIELELINVESNRVVWIGQKKIKKYVSNKKYKI
ncbi:MAG: penicillin-binding protein activator LpoB [Elusimicrobiota bacterium]|jgi:PBP1b-binding outer membrane lipoprotein LpoB|nr:penicillin-binding protein activator LpoB [Elusimicrobiota bacterium]